MGYTNLPMLVEALLKTKAFVFRVLIPHVIPASKYIYDLDVDRFTHNELVTSNKLVARPRRVCWLLHAHLMGRG